MGRVGNQTTEGFDDFHCAGLADMTAEALVVKFPDRFPPEVVVQARERLIGWDIIGLPKTIETPHGLHDKVKFRPRSNRPASTRRRWIASIMRR